MSSFFKAIPCNPRKKSELYGIWKLKAPPRALGFGWLALRKRVPTIDLLRRRGMTTVNGCPMCLRDEETVDHLLLICKSAHSIWMSIIGDFGFCWVLPLSLLELFEAWKAPVGNPRGKMMWRLSFLAVIWTPSLANL
eukprot:TRINITY_DN10717_c0_g1_i6.p1 TRINITY_DN10717_c0_g1~~TRINITY_DN10717_c0_g1_i6.p1  ORF type:complete len:137 (+),score=23.15 TRINITY_DN10717_c0_g1_i6:233-643(+)